MDKNKDFYKKLMKIYIPILVQNGFSQFLNLIDNIMIGSLGTLAMDGVSITNRLFSIFQTTMFGALSGQGIFMAQYYGNKDHKGYKRSFQYMMIFGNIILFISIIILLFKGNDLIRLFLTSEINKPEEVIIVQNYSHDYLLIMLIGLLPFVFSQIYATSLRSIGNTVLPMISSLVAIIVNFLFNYIFIFGPFGLPKLGVRGAAIATVLSRYLEFLILYFGTLIIKNKFLMNLLDSLVLDFKSIKLFSFKSAPLLCNELIYSSSFTIIDQRYSIYGLQNMAAINITSTIYWFFIMACTSMGSATSIVIGQQLGAGEIEQAKKDDLKVLRLNIMVGLIFGTILFICSPLMPQLFDVEIEVKEFASQLLRLNAFFVPVTAIYFTSYFTLRAGGKTLLTFLFDSGYLMIFNVPIAIILTKYTTLSIFIVYLIIRLLDVPKAIIGIILIKSGIWAQNLSTNE